MGRRIKKTISAETNQYCGLSGVRTSKRMAVLERESPGSRIARMLQEMQVVHTCQKMRTTFLPGKLVLPTENQHVIKINR